MKRRGNLRKVLLRRIPDSERVPGGVFDTGTPPTYWIVVRVREMRGVAEVRRLDYLE